jgi:hypothetical protein
MESKNYPYCVEINVEKIAESIRYSLEKNFPKKKTLFFARAFSKAFP